jgi:hypothetical protein
MNRNETIQSRLKIIKIKITINIWNTILVVLTFLKVWIAVVVQGFPVVMTIDSTALESCLYP